jgi:hypothetical protein
MCTDDLFCRLSTLGSFCGGPVQSLPRRHGRLHGQGGVAGSAVGAPAAAEGPAPRGPGRHTARAAPAVSRAHRAAVCAAPAQRTRPHNRTPHPYPHPAQTMRPACTTNCLATLPPPNSPPPLPPLGQVHELPGGHGPRERAADRPPHLPHGGRPCPAPPSSLPPPPSPLRPLPSSFSSFSPHPPAQHPPRHPPLHPPPSPGRRGQRGGPRPERILPPHHYDRSREEAGGGRVLARVQGGTVAGAPLQAHCCRRRLARACSVAVAQGGGRRRVWRWGGAGLPRLPRACPACNQICLSLIRADQLHA